MVQKSCACASVASKYHLFVVCLLSDQDCLGLWNHSMFGFSTASLSIMNCAHIACPMSLALIACTMNRAHIARMPEAAFAQGPDDLQQQLICVVLSS